MHFRSGLVIVMLTASKALLGQPAPPSYGPNFLWGSAVSAHQVEGKTEGGQFSDWYVFEHTDHHIANGDTADVATNHWHRYPEDLALAVRMSANSVRTSIAWEKVEPVRGQFNVAAIQHYREEFRAMRTAGLRPMVTLLHGTTPIWFEVTGGWLVPDSPEKFATYVERVVRELGDVCDLWITINEPMVLIGEGYLEGTVPPQIASPAAAIIAAFNMVRAHRLATARIHEVQPLRMPNGPGAPLRGVGLVNSLDLYDPYNPANPQDVVTAALVAEFSNWVFPNAAVHGMFDIAAVLSRLRGVHISAPGPLQDAPSAGSPVIDWFGINYYTLNLVQFVSGGLPKITPAPGSAGDNGWSIYPAGIERILRESSAHFPGIPLVVTENGVADAQDRYRPQFIRDTLHYLDLARFGHDGLPPIDVRGYYHWSLTDNFEWQSGYAIRFGLVAIDYRNDLSRIPRGSARVYTNEIQARK